jgi:hypothetical protein
MLWFFFVGVRFIHTFSDPELQFCEEQQHIASFSSPGEEQLYEIVAFSSRSVCPCSCFHPSITCIAGCVLCAMMPQESGHHTTMKQQKHGKNSRTCLFVLSSIDFIVF